MKGDKMANMFDSVDIRGLRATHFSQLMNALIDKEESGEYYGNREQYFKRHFEIKEWLQGIIDMAKDPGNVIPKSRY